MPALRKLLKETPQILEAYRNGSTIREIADTYKVSSGTIRNILKRSEEPLRPRGRRPKVKALSPEALWAATKEYVDSHLGGDNELQ
jgi:transposase